MFPTTLKDTNYNYDYLSNNIILAHKTVQLTC